jgi:hypothetical protein
MRWGLTSLVAMHLMIGLPFVASAGDLALGMSQSEVVGAMGPPSAVRLERNGVVCLTYELPEQRFWSHLFGGRTMVAALKENRLVDCATIRSERVRSHCSGIAGRWDPPRRPPLVCDDRWGHC